MNESPTTSPEAAETPEAPKHPSMKCMGCHCRPETLIRLALLLALVAIIGMGVLGWRMTVHNTQRQADIQNLEQALLATERKLQTVSNDVLTKQEWAAEYNRVVNSVAELQWVNKIHPTLLEPPGAASGVPSTVGPAPTAIVPPTEKK